VSRAADSANGTTKGNAQLPLVDILEEESRYQEQLLELERQLGDHLYTAYTGQVKQMAPTMRLRGEL
jgi:hypothetical protein